MSEIKKIQVDGVVYDLTASGEEFESQIKDLDNKVNDLDAKVDSEIQKEADRVDEKINQLNESTNASIDNLTTNISEVETSVEAEKQAREEADTKLQQSIDAITGAAEDVVKYQEFEYQGETRKTIQLANYDTISGVDTEGNGHNLIMLSKWNKADVGSANVQLNLNSTGRPQVNDTEEVAYVSDITNVVKETVGEDGRKTIYLDNHENICGYMPDGQTSVNIAMVSKWGKVDMGSTSVELNLNGLSDHPTYNDTEKIALLKDLEGATAEDIKALEEKVDGIDTKVDNLNTTVVDSNSAINTRIDEETAKLNTRIDSEVLPEISELDKNKVGYFEADKNGIKTKNILLDNYASVLGKDTEGTSHNLIMLSKWNKADVGASGVELNFNGSQTRPTYNDDKELALLEDINGTAETINLVKKDDLTYELEVGDRIAGTISIPKDQFLKSVEYLPDTKELKFVFETTEGEQVSNIDISDLVDTYVAGNGLKLEENKFSINLDPATEAYLEVSESGIKLVGIDKALADKANTSDLVNVVKYQDFGYQGETRKTIQLANYDSISGVTTTGSGVNIAMVSKWDKVDLGSAQVEINLNGSAEHPTYNDEEQLAFVKDVENAVSDKVTSQELQAAKEELSQNFNTAIQGEKERAETAEESLKNSIDSLGVYSIGKVGSFYDIPDKLAQKDICTNANNVVLTFVVSNTVSGDEGGYCTNIYTQKKVYQTLYWKNTVSGRTLTVTENGEVQTAEFKPSGEDQVFLLNRAISGPKFFALTTESTPDEIKAAMTGVISKQLITSEDLDRCYVYGFMIKEEVMNGSIMVGWNGSAYTFTQVGYLNPKSTPVVRSITVSVSPDGVYSVVKNGFSGTILTNTNISSYINPLQESIVDIQGIISVLSGKLTLLENKVDMLQTAASEDVPSFDGSSPINDSAKMYEVSNGTITNTNTITAKNIVLNDSSLSNNARLSVLADGSEFNNFSISGDFPKDDGGNAVVKINNSKNVSFTGLTFDSSNIYNGIEIGLSSDEDKLPNNVLFDNCKFTGSFTNNAILIFGTSDDAVITLNNCSFESVSNALRLSNKSNAKNITVNIVNCTIDKWDSNPMWAGFLILEDYTSKTPEEIATNNLFGDGKIKVNFVNLMHNGVKVLPKDLSKVCGTKDENQVVYICQDNAEGDMIAAYDESIYPVITFK